MNTECHIERRTPPRRLAHHIVTAGACFVFFSVVPVVLCLALIVEDGDAGGPLFLPIFIMGTIFCAGLITLVLGGVVLVTDVLQRRRGRLLWWPAVVVFLLGAAAGGMVGGLTPVAIPAAAGAAAVVAYFIYWMVFSLVSRLLGQWASGTQ